MRWPWQQLRGLGRDSFHPMAKDLDSVIPGNRQRLATKNQLEMALAAAEGAGKGLTSLLAQLLTRVQLYICTES